MELNCIHRELYQRIQSNSFAVRVDFREHRQAFSDSNRGGGGSDRITLIILSSVDRIRFYTLIPLNKEYSKVDCIEHEGIKCIYLVHYCNFSITCFRENDV